MAELFVQRDQPQSGDQAARRRLPDWLRVNLPTLPRQATFNTTGSAVADNGLHTVCEEARCPNIHDCWSRGTATFMVAGEQCTRGCRFCAVNTVRRPEPPDPREPDQLANAVARLRLQHVVITVVNRDDLPDGGATHYRSCIDAVAERMPDVTTELLCSDLAGNQTALETLLKEAPLAVFAHNVESVARLDPIVRDRRASFLQSLAVLQAAKQRRTDVLTKSSLMLGFGESDAEIREALRRLRQAGVDIVTLGQYLPPGRPGERFLPVHRYVHPDEFDEWADTARDMGFLGVAAGPLVRSSFRAGELMREAREAMSGQQA